MSTLSERTDQSHIVLENAGEPSSSSSSSTTDEYDPYLHRNVKHPTSNFSTLILMVKALIGTGVFAIPHVYNRAGYIVSPVSTLIVGVLVTYCVHILVQSQYTLCKRHRIPLLRYSTTFQMALEEGPLFLRCFAPYAAGVVNVFLVINQVGTGCVYVIFVATNLKTAIDTWYEMALQYYFLIIFLPMLAIMLIRNLQFLAPFTVFATFICMAVIISILVQVFTDLPSLQERHPTGAILEFPAFFGTTLFAMVSIGVFISCENNMQTPQSFGSTFGVLNWGMGFVIILYTIFGEFGYLKYGDDIKESITLNLNPDNVLTKIIQIGYSISIAISYAVQCYVAVEIIWGTYLSVYVKNRLLGEYAVRLVIVLTTFLLAISVPKLGLFISFFGALCLAFLGVVIPALIQLCVLYPFNLGRYNYVVIRNVTIIIIGVFVFITGTLKSSLDIIDYLIDSSDNLTLVNSTIEMSKFVFQGSMTYLQYPFYQ